MTARARASLARVPEVPLANTLSRDELWALAHAERAALAEDLAVLTDEQWARPSLCGNWVVEEVVAHLTAAASIGRLRWLRSVLGARFDFDLHNARRLAEHRGATPAETLALFRAIITSTTAASGHTAAWLGEVVVHGQDIRRPLGLSATPSTEVATAVADFYASRDFTVPSKTTIAGLCLEATDGPFATGAGPLVSGPTIALVMVMAGRIACADELTGPGLPTLRTRLSAGTADMA
ncbi:maleylpyruvate isomerase family mycothiol-dependent enzyme [Nocardia sp. NPDC058497]|uniref:maleylpyruvate isomerase family mycothiol-dependent enzyme n=1 Tax=Nocardia sp. NPDC058497 TaxID=3346529 RepID=UPI00365EC98B